MIEYANKLCLAPMVRSGELPIRLLSLRYGCDLLWTPELVDKKILQSTRIINQELNTIDYIVSNHQQLDKKTVIFRKHPVETGRLILQLGSSDPQLAVDAARKVLMMLMVLFKLWMIRKISQLIVVGSRVIENSR